MATSVGSHRQELTWHSLCHLVLSPVPGLPQGAQATTFLIFVFAFRAQKENETESPAEEGGGGDISPSIVFHVHFLLFPLAVSPPTC